MAQKKLDMKTMKEEILNNPQLFLTTFMVQTDKRLRDVNSDCAKRFINIVGQEKIQVLQIMDEYSMLVTMNNVDDMNDLLASVKYINGTEYAIIPVLPISARVRIRISGIPLQLASVNMHNIKELFSELCKELKDVVLSLEKEGNILTGNLIADALTYDLKKIQGMLMNNSGITLKNFLGRVIFKESISVREESRGKFKTIDGMRVTPWGPYTS